MKGNLSKKKGFLGDVLGNDDIKSISDTLEARFDERLESAEDSVLNITQTIIPKLKNELTEYTDDMVDEAYKGIEDLETTVKGKEDVSNKMMATDDDGRYYSGEMTEMRIYQVIGEHIVQDLNVPEEDKIPSVKAVFDANKDINEEINKVEKRANDAYSLAAGAGRAIVFENYNVFCQYILDEGENFGKNYPVGTTILIGKSGVPDLWYYGDSEEYIGFVPDEKEILYQLTHLGWFEIGYYRFAQSENQNIVLDGYATTDDLSKHADNKDLHTTAEEKQKWNAKLDKSNQNGGFVAGNYQENEYAQDTSGVVIGKNASGQQFSGESPVTIGEDAVSNDGVAIGYNASSLSHGTSVGVNAIGGGVSIGYNAKTLGDVDVIIDGEVVETLKNYPINAVQIGEGTNKDEKTVQFYGFKLLDKDGNIPAERLKNASGGGGGNVDLSDYYTKEQIDEKIGDIEALLGGI